MRKLMILLVVIAVAVAVFFGARHFLGRLDGMVEREFEEAATQALGTNVTVGDIRVEMLDGSVTIEDLAIDNPEGFRNRNAFVFGSIEASVDFKTRGVDTVIMDDSQIFVEEKAGRINVQELKKNIESKMSDTVSVGQSDGSDSGEDVHIRLFLMRSTTATLESDSWEKLTELRIDEIEMRDLRGSPESVAEQIATRVIEEITDEAQKALLRAKAEDVGNRALDKLKELLGEDEEDGG